MSVFLGIIAEDDSDVSVIRVFVGKIAKKPFRIQKFVGRGCGKIRGKCRAWSQNLKERGCRLLVVVHDLDQADLGELRRTLVNALKPAPIPDHVIVIPVREIEAWLLADHVAITRAMRLRRRLGIIRNPEALPRAKEHLRDLIYNRSSRSIPYVNTIHNEKIAQECNVVNLRRCESFRPLETFVTQHLR